MKYDLQHEGNNPLSGLIESVRNPILDEMKDHYEIASRKIFSEVMGIARGVQNIGETAERVRSFLLSRDRKPPLNYFLEDFIQWREKNPEIKKGRRDYKQYLTSNEWKQRRAIHLKQSEYRCQLCNSPKSLQVHHRTYERLGCERFTDLIVLCDSCHSKHHGKEPIKPVVVKAKKVQPPKVKKERIVPVVITSRDSAIRSPLAGETGL